MPNWFAPTHHDHLVKHYGLDPAVMVFVDCACGIKNRRADYMVDVTGLLPHARTALGLDGVDYLCDGCTTRLFRENHISQSDFNAMLGAPPENLALVRLHDAEHQLGIENREPHKRPLHAPVTRIPRAANAPAELFPPTLPLQHRSMSHTDSAAKLMRQGVLKDPNPMPLPILK